jgi:hypothetical protein
MRTYLVRKHGFHGTLSFIVALFFLSGLHGNSIAQCTADVDCKGSRICKDGQCVEPVQPQPTVQTAPVKGCRADIDCPGNQICQNGTCVDKAEPQQRQTTIQAQAEAPSLPSVLGKVGLGFGIPYGWIGAGFEFGAQYVAAVGGIGTTIISAAGWSVGVRGYFLNSTHKFRPHVTVLYGPTAAYDIQIISVYKKTGTLNGVSVYLGGDHDVGKIGGFVFTYAIGFITHPDFPKDVQDAVHATGSNMPSFGIPVKVCVGFNYRFGG